MKLSGLVTLGCLLTGLVSCVATHEDSGPSASQLTGCPAGQLPCGNGCRPADGTICCDDGLRSTSSYCLIDPTRNDNSCYVNDRNCEAASAPGTEARFCCQRDGTAGSHDCPAGEKHCGTSCQPEDVPCCEGSDCLTFGRFSDCPATDNFCAYCQADDRCIYCPANSCCGPNVCSVAPDDIPCLASDVCVGAGDGSAP